jgi:hypothetical protein
MSHKRNTSGLIESAKRKALETENRTEKAIRELIKTGSSINFHTVSKAAKVSIPWLYKNERMRERIETLRAKYNASQCVPVPLPERPSEASKEAIQVVLKRRIKELTEENMALKKQLEVAYGQLALKDRV